MGVLWDVEGDADLVKNMAAIEAALLTIAPQALTDNAEITLRLMRALCPTETGLLKRSIRFELAREGEARTSIRRSGALGKTRVVGQIRAGDDSTIVPGRLRGGKKWQLARLMEFGTQHMPAHPFFYPAWRATKRQVRKAIAAELRKAFKAARMTGTSGSMAA